MLMQLLSSVRAIASKTGKKTEKICQGLQNKSVSDFFYALAGSGKLSDTL
jgi:hypothetical protein